LNGRIHHVEATVITTTSEVPPIPHHLKHPTSTISLKSTSPGHIRLAPLFTMDPPPTSPTHTIFPKKILLPLDLIAKTQRLGALAASQKASACVTQPTTSLPVQEKSSSRPHKKLASVSHDTTPALKPDWVAQYSVVRHLVEAGEEECQHESEAVTPANHSPPAVDKDKRGTDAEVEKLDNGMGKENYYFGSKPQMSESSVRDELHTPVNGGGWGNGRQGPCGADPNGEVSADEGVDRGEQGDGARNQGGAWVDDSDTNQGGDGWGEYTPTQNFETEDGAAMQGWGNWGGDGGGWGDNTKDGKKGPHRQENQGWGNHGNNNGWVTNAEDGRVFEAGNNHQWDQPENKRCGNYGHQYEQRGHIRSRHQSEAAVRPFVQRRPQHLQQPQSQRNDNLQSQTRQFDQHQHKHIYTHHPQNQISAKEQEQIQLINELKTKNANQAGLIDEQRFRIAVLENDLKHNCKGKEDAVNASVIIAQTLAAVFRGQVSTARHVIQESSSLEREEETKELKRKMEALEKENKMLRARDWEARHNGDLRESPSDEAVVHALTPSRRCLASRRSVPSPFGGTLEYTEVKGKGKEKLTSQAAGLIGPELAGSTFDAPGKKRSRGEGLRKAFEKDKALAARQSSVAGSSSGLARIIERVTDSEPERKAVVGWDESFTTTTDIPTVPNSPVRASSSTQVAKGMIDVGMESLDDILNDSCPAAPTLQQGDQLLGDIDSETEQLSPQIEAQIKAMQDLSKLSVPKVLKAGTDLKNSFRGADYDHLAPQSAPHRGGMNNYNRFDASSTSNPYSNTNEGEFGSSEEERERVIKAHQCDTGRDGIRYPDLFRYGIQYVPEDDENYIRTVSISNLPSAITLREVLTRVRGGNVANAILMDTQKLMGGTMSALVTFVEDYDAHSFAEYAAQHPITFGDEDEGQTAKVTLIPTPTFPPSQGMKKRMAHGRNDTRCIAILNVPEHLSLSKLQYDIACQYNLRAESLLEIYLDQDNTLHLEFSSMSLAGSAFGILSGWQAYQGLNIISDPDPCAGPLEELALPVPPRPPMLPRGRSPSPPYDLIDSLNSSSDSSNQRHVHFTGVGGDMIQQQRKRLAALTNHKIEIPSFSGSGIKSSSWADEVIDETEFGNPNPASSSAQNQSYPSDYPEHNEQSGLPHAHSEAPPNSPIEGVLDMDISPCLGIKGAADMIVTADVNRLMKETPGTFRKAPVGLTGSKYATIVPGFEDRHDRSGPRTSSRNSSLVYNGSTPDLWKIDAGGRAEKGKGREVETLPEPKAHPELQPRNLLAAALDSGSDGRSPKQIAFEVTTPKPKYRHAPTPYPSPTEETVKPRAGYAIKKPTYTPDRQPEASPTPKSKHLEQPSTPLTDFNVEFEAKVIPHTQPNITNPTSENPHTPANAEQTPPPQTPQKPHQNAETNKTITRSYHPEVPVGEWTLEDLETLKNSSPAIKERYVRLIDIGRGVGEFVSRAEMVPELRPEGDGKSSRSDGDGKGGGEGWKTDRELVVGSGVVCDPFLVIREGESGEGNGNEKGVGSGKEKINPEEIEFDLEDDGGGDVGGQEKRPRVRRIDSKDSVHSDGCSGYMSIGG
jgi:hypothetical protein